VAIHNDTYNATLLTSASDTQSNTWGTPVNVLTGSASQANPFACVAERQTVNVVVNNLGLDMSTAGKVQGQKVVTVQ